MIIEVYSSELENSVTCVEVDSDNKKPIDAVHIRFIQGEDWNV